MICLSESAMKRYQYYIPFWPLPMYRGLGRVLQVDDPYRGNETTDKVPEREMGVNKKVVVITNSQFNYQVVEHDDPQ